MEGEAIGGKEDAAMLNGFFKGGVEGEAYVCLVVGVWLGENASKGLGYMLMGIFLGICLKSVQVR